MAKENKLVTLNDEEGNELKIEVVREFKYKNKDYVLLFGEDCFCDDNCECENECDEIYLLEVKKDKEDMNPI